MEKTILIDAKEVTMKVTANTPSKYRNEFGRDLFKDLDAMNKEYQKNGNIADTSCVERLAFTMAKQADPTITRIDEWLDRFDNPFSMIYAMPDILEVWNESQQTMSEQKKRADQ